MAHAGVLEAAGVVQVDGELPATAADLDEVGVEGDPVAGLDIDTAVRRPQRRTEQGQQAGD
ncbi:hypothetical protein D3C78_1693230 [compost metagenome]